MDPKALMLQSLTTTKSSQISFLQEFVRVPSPNPPGQTAAAAGIITSFLTSNNIPFEIIEPQQGQPNIVSEFHGSLGPGPRVVLNGHIDVFPVAEDTSGWDRDPWSGDIVGDRIHGRGVVDMKSGTASLVIAYAHLYQNRAHLKGSVSLCAVSDEETGGKWGTKYLIQQDRERWGGDIMLSAEPAGCNSIRFSEKGTLRMTCTCRTRAAHGAYLNLSKGAIRTATGFIAEVIAAVEAIQITDMPQELIDQVAKPSVRKLIDETMGPGTSDIILRPTVNVGTIKGGVKVNMIPDTCTFELDIRMPVGLLKEQVLDLIQRSIIPRYAPDATIEISVHQAASNPFSYSSPTHPMVGLLADNAEFLTSSLTDEGPIKSLAIPSMGATDCKHYRYAGVPAFVYGCSPMTSEWFPG